MGKYTLVGVNGNAFSVMGYVRNAMCAESCTKEEIENYIKDATSDDYNHLIVTSMDMLQFLNEKYEEYNDED